MTTSTENTETEDSAATVASSEDYEELVVSEDEDLLDVITDLMADDHQTFSREHMQQHGYTWVRDGTGAKVSLMLTDGYGVVTVPTERSQPGVPRVFAPGSKPLIVTRIQNPASEDEALQAVADIAPARGCAVMVRPQDGQRCLTVTREDGSTVGIPFAIHLYLGAVVAVADGAPFRVSQVTKESDVAEKLSRLAAAGSEPVRRT